MITFFVFHSSPVKGLTHRVLTGHPKEVFCLNYSSNSKLLVSGDLAGQIRIWNTKGMPHVQESVSAV